MLHFREVPVLYFMELPWNTMGLRGVFICFCPRVRHVKLPWKKFSVEIPWNDFHGMFSMLIPWSINLGRVKCRIAIKSYGWNFVKFRE